MAKRYLLPGLLQVVVVIFVVYYQDYSPQAEVGTMFSKAYSIASNPLTASQSCAPENFWDFLKVKIISLPRSSILIYSWVWELPNSSECLHIDPLFLECFKKWSLTSKSPSAAPTPLLLNSRLGNCKYLQTIFINRSCKQLKIKTRLGIEEETYL